MEYMEYKVTRIPKYTVEDYIWEGIGWSVVTLLSGIGAALAPHPLLRLGAVLIAIGSGTKAVDCFQTSAEAIYQELITPESRQILPDYRAR